MRGARANYFLSRIPEFFPDRLATPKWQSCFRTSGFHHLQEARKEGRSVVLVCFHFGTFKLMPFWLRALGIPAVALLRGKSQDRSRAKRMKDRLSPFPKLPTVFYTDDQLRTVIEFLASGHALLVAADRDTGRQITVAIDDHWSFRMATGAFRLASHCNAELIPVCMTDEGRWNFRLEILPAGAARVSDQWLRCDARRPILAARDATSHAAASGILHELSAQLFSAKRRDSRCGKLLG
jgi:lauroyl/myristoyl acyltransferase